MRKITAITTSLIIVMTLAGCANINVTVNTDTVTHEQGKDTLIETDLPQEPEVVAENIQSVAGPYGKLSIAVPDDFECKVCPVDNDEMSYGYYGFTFHPKDKKDGIIAIFVANNFGVCGTELKQEETVIAGKPARIGTYDEHKRWDFIVIGEDAPQIVATGGACESWTDDQWDAVQKIVDTIEFDPSVTAGAVWQYTPESEDTDIGVSMDLSNITPVGAVVHFYRFETEKVEEVYCGEKYTLEKENSGKWEEVPYKVDDFGFNDIAYIISRNDSKEIEVNWEWLYGALSPGTYRMKKTVSADSDGKYTDHELIAQFLITGPDVNK